ncbi:GNAT family N-acetyltransferase [Virgisporangium aurantiacum]|uniref:GNAT family acetyltransferase n=1 Tax=Virgisporangium aurantiacum TaxID=175570 RepID=A0A8J3ZG66_9ACTN|nr:GNAT family N-acetyltransferase [Virgisporangium aurantiacum]GIJ61275.1 GNAT family acetyltransferase [Virgisporangium aurantiacum]
MLTTARLALSPLTPDDAAFFYDLNDYRTQEERASGAEWPTPFLTEAMAKFGTDWTNNGIGYHVVRLGDGSGRAIGISGVRFGSLDSTDNLNVYYSIVESERGKGYAIEATRAALEVRGAAGHGDLPVLALIRPENVVSRRVAERLGFAWTEGRFNDRGLCVYELTE